ncbi:RNase A-like domain-containing protein [Erwinia sp. STN24]|uniref:RNase A-like domain-containing protein n=1 Tax=Erwinia sp. STN24 TaxID=3233996 RepID=UPI003522EA69
MPQRVLPESSALQTYLVFSYDVKSRIGVVVKYDATQAASATRIEVVMKKKQYNNKPYYIATAYPVL